eukprot:TRINITY_DN2194_c0_g6_i1.p1 TRINITY_DN2194_c0_g6~~TRINITY_DN2194_c0_g6_i1.p1  ORF type:complete len:331 (+),score=48.22 TRINITY_DN2194_c0_g6_i1:41-1033(+)
MNKDWNKLLEFETRDLVERFVKNRFGRKPKVDKIHEITSNFIQGREYFSSAKNSDFTVKPLLQYYGVLALSKGLILALNPSLSETHLKASHGLEIKNWKEILKSKDFGKLEITIRNGSFTELLNATDNRNYLRANSSGINWKSGLEKPKKGYMLQLEQLIQYYPDLNSEFKSWTGKNLVYAVISGFEKSDKNKVKVILEGKPKESDLDLIFPHEYCVNRTFENKVLQYESEDWGPNITQKWDNTHGIGFACVIPVLKDDVGLNLISGMFMISYVFGMMARYYPTAWIALRKGEKGDKIYPFAYRMMEFIDNKFPKVIVDFLNAPYPLLDK